MKFFERLQIELGPAPHAPAWARREGGGGKSSGVSLYMGLVLSLRGEKGGSLASTKTASNSINSSLESPRERRSGRWVARMGRTRGCCRCREWGTLARFLVRLPPPTTKRNAGTKNDGRTKKQTKEHDDERQKRKPQGFLVNRVLMPSINEAFFCLMEGVGTAADIDLAMKLGANQPVRQKTRERERRGRARFAAATVRLSRCPPPIAALTIPSCPLSETLRDYSSGPSPSPTASASTPCSPPWRPCRAAWGTQCTGRARCCAPTSTPGGSGARRGGASSCASHRRPPPSDQMPASPQNNATDRRQRTPGRGAGVKNKKPRAALPPLLLRGIAASRPPARSRRRPYYFLRRTTGVNPESPIFCPPSSSSPSLSFHCHTATPFC